MPIFKQIGMQMILFSKDEPPLYQLVFMSQNRDVKSFDDIYAHLGQVADEYLDTIQKVKKQMNIDEIQKELFKNQDVKYRDFQAKLLPTLNPETIIGVRTPILRALAETLYKENDFSAFSNDLPHKYFDENQLHAFLISEIKDFDCCMNALNGFLPFVDNWATCDQMSPKVFARDKKKLLAQIKIWILSKKTYTVRFAVGMLMQYFLDEDFDLEYPRMVSALCSEEYYVKMMIAWYFATALAKQPEAILPFFEQKSLERWTHNKAIQKALESYRISCEQKKYLRTLKI